MATDLVRGDALADALDQDVLTQAGSTQGDNAVPFQINPYVGIASQPFSAEQAEMLLQKIEDDQVEIRPDGLVYLPEIRYRRILNRTFGPGAWALMPRSIDLGDNMLYYRGALFVHGRFVSEAIGEQQYFPNNDRMSYATAAEAAKSNCLVRCCKDLGIASDLWDPTFTRQWLATYAVEVWCQNRQDPHKRKKFWRKRSAPAVDFWPWVEMDSEANAQKGVKPATSPAKPAAQERPGAPANGGSPAGRQAPAQEPAEPQQRGGAAATSAPSYPGEKRLISPKQAGRFRAISRVHNWRDRELGRLLALYRFGSVEEITRDAYEELCSILVDPAELDKIRRQSDQEDAAHDVLEGLLR